MPACERPAIITVANPIMGDVPACAKCAKFAEGG
jgi:hypothetical protein